jgi:uncharacterized membrane protein YphA (DoxX/SURF4 family)
MKLILKRTILILAGALFVFSGAMKAVDSQSFAILIDRYGAGWAGYGAPFISGIEIILGLCLILNIRPRLTSLIVGLLTVVFTIAFTYAFFVRGVQDCGCMGSFRFLKIPAFVSFARNILIIAGCFWIWRFTEDNNPQTSAWKKWVIYIVGSLSFCLSGYSLGAHFLNKNKIHVGDQIDAGALHQFNYMISKGTSFVFIFGADCYHCWNATENVKSIRGIPEFNNVIGIAMYGDTTEYMTEMKPNFPVFKNPSAELGEVINEVPVLLMLKNGKIERIFKADNIPCGHMLKRMIEN